MKTYDLIKIAITVRYFLAAVVYCVYNLYSNIYSIFCANTHHRVKDFEVDEMVENIKNQVCQERNMTLY